MIEFLQNIDIELLKFINLNLSNNLFDVIMPFVRNKINWVPLYLIVGLYLLYNYKWKGFVVIVFVVLSVTLADVVSSHLLKPTFARVRPCFDSDLPFTVRLVVDHCSGAFSFPSSHAANHFAIAISLGLIMIRKPLILAFGVIWAALIGFAQVYVGVHYPSDVLVGSLLGILIGYGMYKLYQGFNRKYKLEKEEYVTREH